MTVKDVNDQRQHRRPRSCRSSNMCVVAFHRRCFCPSRNLSLEPTLHCSHVHLYVLLCNTRQCLQLGRIQPRVRSFAKSSTSNSFTAVPSYERFSCLCSVTRVYTKGCWSISVCLQSTHIESLSFVTHGCRIAKKT